MGYDVVLIDPPWSYHGSQTKWAAAAKFYPTMSDNDLLSFPVRSIMSDKSVMFCWATSPRLDFAFQCISAWQLHYRGVAFVWVKTTHAGIPIGAQGVRPSIVKPTTEYVLSASTVQYGRPMPIADEGVCQTVLAPRSTHSTKPNAVMERIERLYPDASKIELFARQTRDGWAAWGNELPHS